MTLSDELSQLDTIFIDTAPIIYYIEAHPKYGPPVKDVVAAFQSGSLSAISSVVTLTEVLPKPVELEKEELAEKFLTFLKNGKNFQLIEISVDIAEKAGRLLGKYSFLKGLDAIQIAVSIEVGANAFLTNDKKLKQVKEIKVLVLEEYL